MVSDDAKMAGYTAAHTGAAYVVRGAECVRVSGPDAVDYLQRQTTNDLRALKDGAAQLNVLTDPTARIVEVFTVLREGESYLLLAQPGRAEPLGSYLRGRVFFMDDVTVEEADDGLLSVELLGPDAHRVVADVSGAGVVKVLAQDVPPTLLAPTEALDALEPELQAAGAVPLPPEMVEIVRVEQGRPAAGAELGGAYTPLEVGLAQAVSESKGCYTGQEVLARQVTYDKVTRALVGLEADAPLAPGAKLTVDGRRAGNVTSAAVSPQFGSIALAVVRRPHDAPGTMVEVAAEGGGIRAVVQALPFGGGGG